jgi:diguanylate cyclase (GGDEF)-like protein/PAS domain S-box-containing protein
MPRLSRYFSFMILPILILSGILLATLYWFDQQDEHVSLIEAENTRVTQVVSNIVVQQFPMFFQTLPGHAENRELDKLLRDAASGVPNLLKFKLYNTAGITLYSPASNEIGISKSDTPDLLLAARSGNPASGMHFRKTFTGFNGERADRYVVATYIPVYNADKTLIGVAEAYHDATETVRRARHSTIWGGVIVAVIFAMIYMGSLFFIRRIERKIDEQHELLQRSHAELALRESTWHAMLDASLDAVITIDADGKIAEFNRAAERIFGYRHEEVKGRDLAECIIPPAFREQHQAGLRRMVETGQGTVLNQHIELSALHADGHEFPVELAITALSYEDKPVFTGFLRDITERKQAENELRVAAAAFESQECMFITDAGGVILRVNRAFIETTGYSAAEPVGKNPSILKSGRHDAAFYAAMRETLNRDGYWQGEIWNRRKSGEIYPEWQTITAVADSNGKVTHYVSAFSDITKRKEAEDHIVSLAFYDPLTQLPNRRLLMDRLQQALALSKRTGRQGALLFIDLDQFKTLNDTQGHDVGDMLLVEVANRLRSCIREGDTAARLGGDEFVVLLENMDADESIAAAQVEAIGEKIRAAITQPYFIKERDQRSSPSIGITLFQGQTSTAAELLKQADLALYQSKDAGRNTLRFFNQDMQTMLEARTSLEEDLRSALPAEEFTLHYQPQMDFAGRMIGAEALIRWSHPKRGLVNPVDFIPLIEENGLIVPVGHWVLETACKQLAAWSSSPLTRDLRMSVNVSPRQFRQADFVEQIQSVLEQTGADPFKLKLELTESLVLLDVEDAIEKMRRLKSLNVVFSLDDFGTGNSSLSQLKRLPLHQLKIDQSFVRDIATDPSDAAIVQAIITLGTAFGLNVIAEGVENEAQREFLNLHGCHDFQGFLFSKPVPIREFEKLVEEHARKQADRGKMNVSEGI